MEYFLISAMVVSGVAAVCDWRTGHIPNWLTLGTAGVAVVAQGILALAMGGGAQAALRGALLAVAGAATCGLAPLILFRLRAMGGGDVKLFAAIGALCLPTRGLAAETYAFLIALLIVPVWLAYRGDLLKTLGRSFSLLLNPLRPKTQRRPVAPELMRWFRLGPAIFLGTVTMILTHLRGL